MNDYVTWFQKTLTALGYDPGVIDGIAGAQTAAAVSRFQLDAGVVADGVVGPATNNALLLELQARARPLPTADDGADHTHFRPDEFACSCGCGLDVVAALKIFAERLRNHFGWPLIISSGARCPPVNREAGGVPDSCHLVGEAFDGYFPGHMNDAVLAEMAEVAVANGIGVIRYPNQLFCHFQIGERDTITY